ncbi:hypothetical protein BDZ89DRAFT_1075760 [Hymenopellis radicata]|nr:hypothetical protein BDZ89DRAFT_1075760 [Hymenopellis radicata]
MPIPQLPPELIEGILQNAWHDALNAWQRIQFMKACPLVNREWRASYDMIASRDVYIPSMQYLHYLLRIISTGRSHVHVPSRFAVKTRSIIVQKVDLRDYNWGLPSEQTWDQHAEMVTYKKIISELQYSSFSGVHLCFPAATHIIFEAITTSRTVGSSTYSQLRVRLDGHTTVNAEWRVDLGYRIEPEKGWKRRYRRKLTRAAIDALDGHIDIDIYGFPPDADDICDSLRLECDNVLALAVSWEPEPFPRFGSVNLNLYFKRAAVGYYSVYILVDYLRHWWDDVKHRPLSPLYDRPKCFHIKQDIQPFYGQRILDVLLAVPVNLYIMHRWPLFAIGYTGLIFCFCSKHSFLVSVSILTILLSFVTTSVQFLIGLVFSIITFLVYLITTSLLFLLRLAFYGFKIFIALAALKRLLEFIQETIEMY